jgi:preprotein translocase subunit SecE
LTLRQKCLAKPNFPHKEKVGRVGIGAREPLPSRRQDDARMAGEKNTPGGKAASKNGETIEGSAEEVKKRKRRTNPIEFFQQVRAEGEKVTWTSWRETWISTVMVLFMVVIMAIFFLIVDQTLRFIVCQGLQLQCGGAN